MSIPVWPKVTLNSLADKVVYLNINGRQNPLAADFRKAVNLKRRKSVLKKILKVYFRNTIFG